MKASLVPLFATRIGRRSCAFALAVAAMVAAPVGTISDSAARGFGKPYLGPVEYEVKSQYSHIRVHRRGTMRTMAFVRDTGEEALETQIDLARPHELRFTYLQHMFLSYVFRPEQERVLIVGLGGGSMVHFLKRYDPNVYVDAVEIDPVVVGIAAKYFGIRNEEKVNVVTADGFDYLAETQQRYDVIYMDAFLRPSRETDTTGIPLKLQTLRFYQSTQEKLKPGGLMVFNLNPHRNLSEDIRNIRDAFPQTYVFAIPRSLGVVVVASTSPVRVPSSSMMDKAKELDGRFKASFSFQTLAGRLKR